METNNSKEELGYRHSLSVYAIEPSQTATQQGSWSADAASAVAEIGRRPRACPNPPPDTAPRRGIPGANTSALTGRGAVPLSDEWGAYGMGHSSALAVVLPFGELIEDIVDPVIPAPLLPRFWIHVAHGAPNAQGPLADDQARGPARSRRSRNTSAQLAVDSPVVRFAWVSSPLRKHR